MTNLDTYYERYTSGTTTTDSVGDYSIWPWPETPYVPYDTHPCYPVTYYYAVGNTTEKAFELLKLFVKEKVITEPKSFKKFCELVEKIAKMI